MSVAKYVREGGRDFVALFYCAFIVIAGWLLARLSS